MRKVSEELQVMTALERAEQRLVEAIENARKSEEGKANFERGEKDELDPMSELKIDLESSSEEEGKFVPKKLYGYEPEFSRSEEIDSDLIGISEDKKNLLKRILGEDMEAISEEKTFVDERSLDREELRIKLEEELRIDKSLLNEDFHSGYDALKEIAGLNRALLKRTNKSLEAGLISESEDYEIKSFNEGNIFEDEERETEAIMPWEFELHSFDDESEEAVTPYAINQALVLGDVIPPDHMEEEGGEDNTKASEKVETSEEDTDINFVEIKSQLYEKSRKEADEILEKSRLDAQTILDEAEQEAKKIIEEKVAEAIKAAEEKGFAEGFDKGQKEGFIAAEDAVNLGMQEEAAAFRKELEIALYDFDDKKEEILERNLGELTDLAVTVAEKVINISLKSSKDVVAKMIVAAAEHCRNKEWAKVYISHEDKAIAMNLEKELVNALNQISPNVRVIVMEDEPAGTCIIESPDQIVDAGVVTQMENIREIVKDGKM